MSEKVIAIMDKPRDCENCVFGVCKYSTPLSTRVKGYCCGLQEIEDRIVDCFDYDSEVHLENCPLVSKESYDKKIRDRAIDEFAEAMNNKINEFVLQHKDNLDFASGISVVWSMVDEIAEQMKEVGE